MQASYLHGNLAGGIERYPAAQNYDTHNPYIGLIHVAHGITPMTAQLVDATGEFCIMSVVCHTAGISMLTAGSSILTAAHAVSCTNA